MTADLVLDPRCPRQSDATDLLIRAAVEADRRRLLACVQAIHRHVDYPGLTAAMFREGYDAARGDILVLFGSIQPHPSGQETLTTSAPAVEEIKKHLDEYRKAVVAYLHRAMTQFKSRGFSRDMIAYLTLETVAKDIEGNLIRDPSEK